MSHRAGFNPPLFILCTTRWHHSFVSIAGIAGLADRSRYRSLVADTVD